MGTLQCLGRIDHQIKLRGFRIELGEIESLLAQQDGVVQAVAIIREDVPGDGRLVAYVVGADNVQLASNDILAKLKNHLPEYMVPSACVVLDALPLTPNGKVDRKALPKPIGERQDSASTYVAPRTEAERRLTSIWEKLLGVSPLGVQDDFFDVGGHSLLAVRLVSEIEVQTGKRISLAALLQGRTIEYVARIFGGEVNAKTESPFVPTSSLLERKSAIIYGRQPSSICRTSATSWTRPTFLPSSISMLFKAKELPRA